MESSTPHREQDGHTMSVEEALRIGSEVAKMPGTVRYEWPETQYRLRDPNTVTIEEIYNMTDDEFSDFQMARSIVDSMMRHITRD